MSDMGITGVLQQMRALSSQIDRSVVKPTSGDSTGVDFGAMLKSSIDKVQETQDTSESLKKSFLAGDPNVELADVMIASAKADLSFQAMNQVRNKMISAYQDIMNMQI